MKTSPILLLHRTLRTYSGVPCRNHPPSIGNYRPRTPFQQYRCSRAAPLRKYYRVNHEWRWSKLLSLQEFTSRLLQPTVGWGLHGGGEKLVRSEAKTTVS